MAKTITNNTQVTKTYSGQEIEAGATYTMLISEEDRMLSDSVLMADISTGAVTYNPGTGGLTANTAVLSFYLDNTIFPFIKNLIRTFAAQNIAMGITQAGKTGLVLGMFSKPYDIYSNGFPISLKNAFDTGSLYEARAVIQHIRDNPPEYNNLSPFVTDARLLSLKNSIETVLGLPLST